MIEHKPWCGPESNFGIDGQRIAIVGYSHYRDPKHPDNDEFTVGVMRKVLANDLARNSLFPRVPGYFGYERDRREEFWERVWFFNFIPQCIGTDDEKFSVAGYDLNERGRKRFLRILREAPIEKVFVFTTKGWSNCPYTDEERKEKCCATLGPAFKDVTWGTYTLDDRKVLAFGFCHPQRARKAHMRAAVNVALARKN